MANTRLANTYYIDTQFATNEELAIKNIRVRGVILTATGANGRIVLSDSSLGVKADLRVVTSGETTFFDFGLVPIVFSTSIRPTTLSNAVATVLVEETRG